MSAHILGWSLTLAQVLLAFAMGFAAVRFTRGPRAQDRVIGLDTFYVNAMLMLVTIGIRSGVTLYFEAALIIGMLGFVSTVALSKFLMRGEVIE
ncbi:K+/H+ antiporter subunit F [Ancylobacter amanitiformis]|uniref:Multicomponent K+:H+ antiporter subunit F n=1 Tax=Ancylobacter amanitiformis TaxID=217069 RepID=A0ABU0LLQ2_9HYPH|nr:K+/H+ antiporter subunit F [Ancylobacter amanitiformis]MDQ0509619.1 multicomponent K+:H+ antiporter subunit F [Ancylobacter amanitiformis]